AGDVRGDGGHQPVVGAGGHEHGPHLLGAHSGVVQGGAGRLQRQVLDLGQGVEALADAGLGDDLLGGHRRPVGGRVADQVLVAADLLAAGDGQGQDLRLHGEVPHDDGPVGSGGGLRLDGRRPGTAAPTVAGGGPADEALDVTVLGAVDDDMVVVAQFRGG